jgi:hypothetical protein
MRSENDIRSKTVSIGMNSPSIGEEQSRAMTSKVRQHLVHVRCAIVRILGCQRWSKSHCPRYLTDFRSAG